MYALIGFVYEEFLRNSWIRSAVEVVWMYGIEWRARMKGSEARLGLEDSWTSFSVEASTWRFDLSGCERVGFGNEKKVKGCRCCIFLLIESGPQSLELDANQL